MKYTAFDVETTGFLKYEGDQIFAYSITDWDGNTEVHRIPWTPGTNGFRRHDNFLRLQDYWNDVTIAKIMHNAKFDYGFCLANGIQIPTNTEFHDTMIMSQMLQNLAASHALDELAEAIFKYHCKWDTLVAKEVSKLKIRYRRENPAARIGKSCYQFVDEELMTPYQKGDGERTMLLYQCFAPKLFSNERMWADYLVELELLIATINEETHGILVDVRQSRKLQEFLSSELKLVEKQSLDCIGKKINFNSSAQVADLLSKDLGLRITETTTKGAPSASKDVLLGFRGEHPVIDLILKYRAYSKGITSVESYLDLMDPRTNLIHANIKTNQAVTGRESCAEPNLQNVAKEVSMKTVYAIPARRCFRAEQDHVLFLVDYAGIELRLIVSVSGEEEFINAMRDGLDVHDLASSCLYGTHWDEVNYMIGAPESKCPEWMKPIITNIIAQDVAKGNHKRHHTDQSIFKQIRKTMRDGTKQYEFGIAYGGGYHAITHDLLGLTNQLKMEGHTRFEKRFPKVAFFTPNIINQVRSNGYVIGAFGRKLFVRRSAAYQGSNYIIQNTAASVLKRGQVRIDKFCKYDMGNVIRQLVPIHDELIIKYPRSLLAEVPYILPTIEHLMTVHDEIAVPLEVEWKMTTSSWAAAKPFKYAKAADWEFASEIIL